MNKSRMFGGGIAAMMTSAIALTPWAPSSMCMIEGEGAGGAGGGGASGLLDDATPTPSPTPSATPTPSPTPSATPTPSPGPTGDADALAWASGVSTTADGENASNFDWLKSKGVKDLDGLVKMTRDTEAAFHGKGTIKVPGADAKPEEVAAFNKAIGVPEKAADYTIELPAPGEGDDKLELDTAFLDPMREAALKAGVPKVAFEALGKAFVQHQLDSMANAARAQDTEVADLYKEWGANKDANIQDFRAGAKLLGLTRADVAAWQTGAGSGEVMKKLAALGKMAGEDLLAGGTRQNFGVSSKEEAQRQITTMSNDKDVQAKLKAKDPATVATWNRLNDAIAEYAKREAGK